MKNFIKFSYLALFNALTVLMQVLPDSQFGNRLRGSVYGLFFKAKGVNLQISKSVHILYPRNIVVGNDVFIGFNSWVNAQGGLSIESEAMLGPFCAISTGNHTRLRDDSGSFRFGPHSLAAVTISKGAWLGSHVSVTAGSSVGTGSVIGAGGVVIGSVPSNALYAGVPAKEVKRFVHAE